MFSRMESNDSKLPSQFHLQLPGVTRTHAMPRLPLNFFLNFRSALQSHKLHIYNSAKRKEEEEEEEEKKGKEKTPTARTIQFCF